MAFNTNLQQVLAYLKAGHPIVPNMQAPKAIPQFVAPKVVPAVTTPQQAGQTLQGTMPMTAPR